MWCWAPVAGGGHLKSARFRNCSLVIRGFWRLTVSRQASNLWGRLLYNVICLFRSSIFSFTKVKDKNLNCIIHGALLVTELVVSLWFFRLHTKIVENVFRSLPTDFFS